VFRLVLTIDLHHQSTASLTPNASLGTFLSGDQSEVDLIQVETIVVKAVRSRTDNPNEKMQKKVQGCNTNIDVGFSHSDFLWNIFSSPRTCPSAQHILKVTPVLLGVGAEVCG